MIENCKKQLDNGRKVGVIFMDLPKAFDTINHCLLLTKLKAYGFSNQALSFLQSYLCNRCNKWRIINGSFSSWNEVITGVHQSSNLGHCSLTYSWMIFFFLSRNVNYVTMPMATLSLNQEKICRKLKTIWKWVSWFYINGFMKMTWYKTLVNVNILWSVIMTLPTK